MSEKKDHNSENEEFNINVNDEEFARSVSKGVMDDNPNYSRLLFWSILGTVIFAFFVYILASIYDFNKYLTEQNVSASDNFYQVEQLKEKANKRLTSFGVVDSEKGIYRIPIDSAINEYVEEHK